MQDFFRNIYKHFFKRVIDFIASLAILLITSPFFIVIMIILIFVNRGQPFFFQHRPGRKGRIFRVIKFKTMSDKKDQEGRLLPDAYRITSAGKFIRKTSLDELPQLLSVLKGDMSLVGPRPLLIEYLPLYSSEQARRHEVKPGITGWAQVNGRNAISWEEKFKHDIYYIDHISFIFDIKILFLTVWKVFKREGIDFDSSITMTRFTGSKT